MSQAIRIALVIAAIIALVAGVAPLVVHVSEGLLEAYPMLNNTLTSLVPYMGWARRLMNALIGNATVAGILIFFTISMPVLYFFTGLISRIFRLIIGQ